MRIGIIGAGPVGRALAVRAAESGFDVRVGRRNTASRGDLPEGIVVCTPAEAADGADVVFLSVPADSAMAVVEELDLSQGTVVDCTNPLRWDAGPVWAPPPAGSQTAELQAAFPTLEFVKALNHFGAENHLYPRRDHGEGALALVAGRDPSARSRVMAVLAQLGFSPADAGGLRNAAGLENLAVLWIHLSNSSERGRDWTFGIETP